MATKPFSVHVAKTHLSRLIERALAGEEVIISRGKTPVVRLVPVTVEPPRRQFGTMKGRAAVGEAFFEPLSEDELEAWES
jgi:prevent-host-death family protein